MKKVILIGLTLLIAVTFGQAVKADDLTSDFATIISLGRQAEILQTINEALSADLRIEREKQKILTCESGYRHDGVWGDNGKSYGIAQFQKRTFNNFKKLAGRPELSWYSQKDQLWLLDWALRHNFGKYWTCYKKGR
jgi:hypothetical protein